MARHTRLLTAFAVALLQSCKGCEDENATFLRQFADTFGSVVDIPVSDATPPTVTLTIPDLGSGQVVLTESSASSTIPMTGVPGFFIIATAEDAQGVKEVGFEGSSTVTCHQDGVSYNQTADLQGPKSSDPGASGKALTRRWLPDYIDDTYLGCFEGWERRSASLTLHAIGSNFGGLSGHSASVTFVWK